MKLTKKIKILAIYFEQKKNTLFTHPVSEQKKYLKSLGPPNNDLDRSYNQYKCKMKLYGFPSNHLINLASGILVPLFLLMQIGKSSFRNANRIDAVFILDGKQVNILPDTVSKRFPEILYYDKAPRFLGLNNDDKIFIKKIWKVHPFSWHFIFKIMIKISLYRYIIDTYKPKAIIVCAEYSFTSSVLTSYCEKHDISHINVMHGEKLFYMRDSFFRFHNCYVWDVYYKNLFIALKAESNQFVISIPKSLVFEITTNIQKTIDYTYYLANESTGILKKISKILTLLAYLGFKVAVRPHPRYSNQKNVGELFKEFDIENPEMMPIESSLGRTKNAVALYSTVLNQAYHNDVNVVIDDLSNPVFYKKLFDLQYINLNRSHDLLSKLLD